MRSLKFLIFIDGLLISFSTVVQAEKNFQDQEVLNRKLRQDAISGNISQVEQRVRSGADINGIGPYGETALDYTVRLGHHKAAIRLLRLGANPNIEDSFGILPLFRAAGDCNASRVVEALLQAGSKINQIDLYGRTALMNAAQADCARTAAVLLNHSLELVNIDARNDSLQSALDLVRNGLIAEMLEIGRQRQKIAGEPQGQH